MEIDAKRVREIRRARGWTQADLAQMMDVSDRTVQRAEATGRISSDALSALCAVIEVDRTDLMRDSIEPFSHDGRSVPQPTKWIVVLAVLGGVAIGLAVSTIMPW